MKNYVKATKIYIFLLNNFFYTPHQNYLKGDKNKAQFVGVKNNIVLSKIRERSLMTSHIRVGRGVQDSPKKGTL